jgi:hypothetical protein
VGDITYIFYPGLQYDHSLVMEKKQAGTIPAVAYSTVPRRDPHEGEKK